MLQAYRMSLLVVIDKDVAVQNETRPINSEVTLEELKNYLQESLRVDWDAEGVTDTVGMQSLEADIEGLTEISSEEVATLHPNQ